MSVVLLDEYKTSKTKENRQEVIAERARILNTVSRKAQEKTLTLQETTDLYAQFNSTYESTYSSKTKHKEDESWALKLLQECEEDTDKAASLETRVNGIPLTKSSTESKATLKMVITDTKASNQNFHPEEEIISVKEQPKLRDSFFYEQFNVQYDIASSRSYQKSHKSFVSIIAISIMLTMAALIGSALFL